MMKLNSKNIIYILVVLLSLMFVNFILDGKDIFVFIFSFSLFLIFVNSFFHINIEKQFIELKKENFINSQVKLFYYIIILIFLINIIYIGITYIITLIFNNSYYMHKYNYVFLFMSITIFTIPVINILSQYLLVNNHKKLSKILKKIFYFIWIFLVLILLIINYKFNIINYKFAIYIYLMELIAFIITIFCCLILIKDKNIFKLGHNKKRNENKVVLKKQLKLIFSNNISMSIKRIIYLSYYYTSIIIVFYVLLYKYNYDYSSTIKIITDTYLYETCIICILIILTLTNINKELSLIISSIKNNNYVKLNIDVLFINVIKKVIPITILICILSGSVTKLLFNSNNSVIFMLFIWTLPFIVLYIIGIKLLEVINNKKILYLILFIGIFVKIVLIVPLINSFYRMGYNLIYGDIISNIIGVFVSYIITMIYLNKKYKVNFTKTFDKILNIIYENIILMLILIIFSMIIPLNVDTKLQSLTVIIIYGVIFILYFYVKKLFFIRGDLNEK